MNFNDIITLLPIIGIGVFFFFYYRSPTVREKTKSVLRFAPMLLSILASRTKDKPGVFDKHDMMVLTGNLIAHIHNTVNDPANTNFADVEDDLFEFVRSELDRFWKMGMTNVPDVNDESVRTQIRVVFTALQEAFSEDTTGDSSQN